MNILDQAESIISDAIDNPHFPLSTFHSSLYEALCDQQDHISFSISADDLKDFLHTPLGRLWTLMATRPTPSNRQYTTESIKILRKILSNVKTLSDAAMLQEPPAKDDDDSDG